MAERVVSILVLLEIALEEPVNTGLQLRSHCRFNPCSIGNCSGRRKRLGADSNVFWFQSLFYWKLLWKKGSELLAQEVPVSFNPCSIGNCSGSFCGFLLTFFGAVGLNPGSIGNFSVR